MMFFRLRDQRGFTYTELLISITIVMLVFYITIPLYKRYNSLTELKTTAQRMRDVLRSAQNKAQNGVVSSSGVVSNWVVHVHQTSWEYEYETGACPVITDSNAAGYNARYTFMTCPGQSDYRLYDFPSRFSIEHQYTGESEADIFFAPVTGRMSVYNASGVYLGDTIDIKIQSDDYTDMYVIFHINGNGAISEEKF